MANKEAIKFNEYLRFLREEHSLTKTDLAQKVDVSLTYIIMLEKGTRKPPEIEKLEILADAIGCSEQERDKLVRLGWIERDPKGYSCALKAAGASLKTKDDAINYFSPEIIEALKDPIAVKALLVTHQNTPGIKLTIKTLLDSIPDLTAEKRKTLLALCK
jgi:transcriptional regulator with XRE-family HTH domain